jgi:hypothetical protein
MENEVLPHVIRRLETAENRIDKLEDRLHSAIFTEVAGMDRRVQHMEDGHIHQSEQIGELKLGLERSLSVGEAILAKLDEHITTENRDRIVGMGLILLTLLGVFFSAIWERLFA